MNTSSKPGKKNFQKVYLSTIAIAKQKHSLSTPPAVATRQERRGEQRSTNFQQQTLYRTELLPFFPQKILVRFYMECRTEWYACTFAREL